MTHPVSPIPGYATCEYQLVILPHEDLYDQINTIKKSFAEKYELPVVYFTPPSITLIRFSQYEMAEERIIRRIRAITTTNAPFKIELADYGSFPTHTIYIHVKTKEPIIRLVKQFKQIQQLLKQDNGHKPHFITEPYIKVASQLLPWQYEKGWLEYRHTHFSGTFLAGHLVLQKRKTGEKKYLAIQQLKLMNAPINSEQFTLF